MNWSAILDGPGHGKPPYQTLTNAVRVLERDPIWGPDHLWFDEFSGRVMCAQSVTREWRDDDDIALTVYMQDTTGMTRIQKHLVRDAIDLVSRRRSRHEVRDWLHVLHWDGIARIAHAFEDHWGVECTEGQPCEYVRAASANLFIGLVARVERPGCKMDTMVVFEGRQGLLKSSALDRLGGQWFAAIDESASTKDFLQVLRGKWLIELGEMSSVSKSESAHVKGMLSRRIDTYRASYGYRSSDVPRQCVFAGTTNRNDWSTDDTGDRRFWPIQCGAINLDTLSAAREQLFAEAVAAFAAGATWWEMPSSAAQVQADRLPEHAWSVLILPNLLNRDDITMAEIMASFLKFKPEQMTVQAQRDVGAILRRAGWVSKASRTHGGRAWFRIDA